MSSPAEKLPTKQRSLYAGAGSPEIGPLAICSLLRIGSFAPARMRERLRQLKAKRGCAKPPHMHQGALLPAFPAMPPAMPYSQVLSTGSYVPERVITNAEVDTLIGEATSDWLIANVGIRERRWMAPDQTTSDLVVEAARRALKKPAFNLPISTCSLSPPTRPITFPPRRRPSCNTS